MMRSIVNWTAIYYHSDRLKQEAWCRRLGPTIWLCGDFMTSTRPRCRAPGCQILESGHLKYSRASFNAPIWRIYSMRRFCNCIFNWGLCSDNLHCRVYVNQLTRFRPVFDDLSPLSGQWIRLPSTCYFGLEFAGNCISSGVSLSLRRNLRFWVENEHPAVPS